MFKMLRRRTELTPGQLARVAFGVVMLAGAARIVALADLWGAVVVDDHVIARAFGWTWLAATAAAGAGYVAACVLPPPRRRDALLHASFVIPAVGVALMLPLTIHLAWWLCVDDHSVTGFGEWVSFAVAFTGFAHVVFAGLTGLRASQLARGKPAIHWAVIYGWSLGAGMIPVPFLPSGLFAITALPILPLLYLMKPLGERERARCTRLPLAIALPG